MVELNEKELISISGGGRYGGLMAAAAGVAIVAAGVTAAPVVAVVSFYTGMVAIATGLASMGEK